MSMNSVKSLFDDVQLKNPNSFYQLNTQFKEDPAKNKLNLCFGAYRNEKAKPWVLPVVQVAKKQMAEDMNNNHEYLPILGLPDFRTAAVNLLLGASCSAVIGKRSAGVQCLSGTGALCVGAKFLKQHYNTRKLETDVYVAKPSWFKYHGIFKNAGFNNIKTYRYWNSHIKSLNFDGLITDLTKADKFSIVVLQACAHNPTGVDPTLDQWKEIANVCKQRNLFPFFDCTYQGFASGEPTQDAWSVRYFVDEGFELFASQSFSKNFGLYNERVGNLTVVLHNSLNLSKCLSQFESIIRTLYSSPPNHGAKIVSIVLNNSHLKQEWIKNMKKMAVRIQQMRELLYSKLQAKKVLGDWKHCLEQTGMFFYTGLSAEQVAFLKGRHIYVMENGCINISSLNNNNIDYFVKCVFQSMCDCKLFKEQCY